MARIIILNGVSSAGKSTLARAIQKQAPSTFLHIEMDAFISFLPAGHELRPEWFIVDMIEAEGGALPKISNGPRGELLLQVMRQFVFDAAAKGFDLVVDEVCHLKEIENYRAGLKGHDVSIVKVHAPMDIVVDRERARGDRLLGLAREQSSHLHTDILYDAEVDTSSAEPKELATKLLAS